MIHVLSPTFQGLFIKENGSLTLMVRVQRRIFKKLKNTSKKCSKIFRFLTNVITSNFLRLFKNIIFSHVEVNISIYCLVPI